MNPQILKNVINMALAMQRESWEQGNLAYAMLELGDERTTILLARESVLRQTDDGRAAVIGNARTITDPCSMGEALLYAWEKTGDPLFKTAYDKLLHWALVDAPRSENGILYHNFSGPHIWIDSVYMLCPFLAAAGEYDEALKQLDGHWDVLFVEEIGLLAHIWDAEKQTFRRGVIWQEGQGWVIAAMAQIIDKLPEDYAEHKQQLIARSKLLIDNSLTYMREDYHFHDALNDPSTVVENGLTMLLAYGLYHGVMSGWLDASYIDTADAMFAAVEAKVDDYGLVQDVCSARNGFKTPEPNGEGQAWYIMLCAARMRYDKQYR